MKVNASKNMVMVLNGKEGLKCEVYVDGIRLEHIWYVFWMNQVQMGKVVIGRKVAVAVRSLINGRDLQLECANLS